MSARHWVGLDVGEAFTSICVLGESEPPLIECSTGSGPDEIARGLSGIEIADIQAMVMESGASTELQRQLQRIGYPVSVLDARKTHRYLSIRQNKTDLNDARGLAEIARLGRFSRLAVHCRSTEAQELRNQLAVRQRLIVLRSAVSNSLRSMLRNHGSGIRQFGRGKAALKLTVEAELILLEGKGMRGVAKQLTPLLNVWEAIAAYTDRLDEEIESAAMLNPVTNRFMQIPGVGPICALSFYAAIDDPSRFERSGDVGAYLGMVPKVIQSGNGHQRSGITKAGSVMTRSYLVLAAGVMISRAKTPCAIRDWGVSLRTRLGYRKARTAVARKLAVAMLSMWKGDRDFEPYPI
ncbi:IS110 family transposase [Sphingomonas sp. ZT3P38]|uniref:IS110 family transposase n=1 Tax=Parasphingomonas zepuensis TaxID=3096161 RepID=UPI002FCB7D2D